MATCSVYKAKCVEAMKAEIREELLQELKPMSAGNDRTNMQANGNGDSGMNDNAPPAKAAPALPNGPGTAGEPSEN